ncbi:hypothetical protein AD953_03830, partial [Acetobacter malorum]
MSLSDSFAPAFASRSPLRQAIIQAMRQPEEHCVAALTPDATLTAEDGKRVTDLAAGLATSLRAERNPGIVESLVQEFALSSAEGVALMCLAEALLRIPDTATRDGDAARTFAHNVTAGMIGVNVPIPVPMAFHSF